MESSLEEDELVQMVQDFIESGSTSTTSYSTSSNCHALHHRTQLFILQDILRSDTAAAAAAAAEAKVMKYVLKHMRSRHGSEKAKSDLIRWLVTRLRKNGLNASVCQTSWSTSLGCPAGEYEYIEVITEDEPAERLIVDIDLRSQFELARPTEYYKELTDTLPVIFVGTEKKLCKIISLLCSAAKQSLRENGLHVPPWRTTTYMQSKWLSVCRKEPDPKGNIIGNRVFPIVKPKKRDLSGESGLSSQLSNMSINCC